MTDSRFEAGVRFSDQDITDIESVLGRSLPVDYQKFVKHYGGAFVGGTFDGAEDFPILDFFQPGKAGGILDVLNIYDDFREDKILPFARDELGNIYVQTPDESIYYINYYGGRTSAQIVAENFKEFISKIVVDDN